MWGDCKQNPGVGYVITQRRHKGHDRPLANHIEPTSTAPLPQLVPTLNHAFRWRRVGGRHVHGLASDGRDRRAAGENAMGVLPSVGGGKATPPAAICGCGRQLGVEDRAVLASKPKLLRYLGT